MNSPRVTLTPDRTIEKDTEPTAATRTGIAGDQSAMVCDDSQSTKAKKMSVKSNPKPSNKVIKFHEYKGPPSTPRPACTIALTLPPVACSPPLKDDLFQKLQQRQLCLQMQLQLEFCNRQLMANLTGQGPCDSGSVNQLQFNDLRGSLGSITNTACKEPVGQPSLAKVPFSPTRTPLLLQPASSLMTSPFKFLSNIGDLSQSLLPSSVGMSLSLPVTAGSQCMASSLMSSCERPGGIPVTSAIWRGDQPWNTRLVQSDLSKISIAVNKPGNEPIRTCASLNNMLIVSSGSCGNSVKSFREANPVQSTTVAVASAMTSAPILCTGGGKLFPNSVPSMASNSSKAKNPISGCPSAANRTATVVIPSRLEDVKVADLKAECRKRKLVVSGPKPNLIERLKPFEEDILKCLSINLHAAVLDDDFFSTESKQPAVVGGQASSASSLTSVDSGVNMQPAFCPAHEEELNRGGVSTAENKPAHVVISNVSSDLDCIEPDAFKTTNNPMFQVPLNFGSNSKLMMSDASVNSCASQNCAPSQFSVSTVATDMYIPSSSKLSHHPISLCPELPQEKSSVKDQLCATKPLVSFALPSVSQWYRLPQPGSIPASNSSLSALPASMFFPNSSLATAATSSASVASIQVPNYVINGTTRVAIPLPSSSCMTTHPFGFGVQPQCTFVSPQPRFSPLTLEQSKTINAVTSCDAQTSIASGIKDKVSAKDVHLLGSPSEASYIWSACGRTDLEMPACLEPSTAAPPPQILSPSDLLNWQQRQIQELQKQLHLSRLQLLETNRRVLEQREQFHTTTTVPTSRALCTTSSASTVKSALAVPDSSKTLEGKAMCNSNMGFEYDSTLSDIPKLSESACRDAMEELFEDFIVGISPMNGCIPLLDGDVTVDNTEEEEEQEQAFGDSCDELLAEGMDDHKSEEVIRLATGFLSPGYDATDHSVLEMCAMEVDIETGDTNPK